MFCVSQLVYMLNKHKEYKEYKEMQNPNKERRKQARTPIKAYFKALIWEQKNRKEREK